MFCFSFLFAKFAKLKSLTAQMAFFFASTQHKSNTIAYIKMQMQKCRFRGEEQKDLMQKLNADLTLISRFAIGIVFSIFHL